MDYLPSIKQLQYLKALDEYKTFSKAAESCFVTQSTLSSGISTLEELIGVELIDRRVRKNVQLTQIGEHTLEKAKVIISLSKEIKNEAIALTRPFTGKLKLGAIPTVAPYILPKIIKHFKKHFPSLEFEIIEDMTDNLLAAIDRGQVDLALLAFPYSTPNLKQFILTEEPFYMATPKNEDYIHKSINPEILKNIDNIILLSDGHCLKTHIVDTCELGENASKQHFKASSIATILKMVNEGLGVTFIPEIMLDDIEKYENIRTIPFDPPFPGREIGYVWNANTSRSEEFEVIANETLKTLKS